MSTEAEVLDRARAAKEVAILALVLTAPGVNGDFAAALDMLDEFKHIASPESWDELDAAAIAAQAIRQADAMRHGDLDAWRN